jgi:hypothetical protein
MSSDRKFVVQIMTVDNSPAAVQNNKVGGTFAWRFEDDNFFSTEAAIGSFTSAQAPYALTSASEGNTGVFIYWDAIKAATPSFQSNVGQIAAGDVYQFKIAHDFVNADVDVFDAGDSNTLHQLVECSGRGTCDSAAGKCRCQPGYSGEACQRSEFGGGSTGGSGGARSALALTHPSLVSPQRSARTRAAATARARRRCALP